LCHLGSVGGNTVIQKTCQTFPNLTHLTIRHSNVRADFNWTSVTKMKHLRYLLIPLKPRNFWCHETQKPKLQLLPFAKHSTLDLGGDRIIHF
jgi:hypothetical protein